ncbi:MAG: hypothetical protein ACK559_19005, partial [bacterium]
PWRHLPEHERVIKPIMDQKGIFTNKDKVKIACQNQTAAENVTYMVPYASQIIMYISKVTAVRLSNKPYGRICCAKVQ